MSQDKSHSAISKLPGFAMHRPRQASNHKSVSYTPSYMSASAASSAVSVNVSNGSSSNLPSNPIATRKPVESSTPNGSHTAGLLMLLVPDQPHQKTIQYLHTILAEQSFSEIVIVGSQAQASVIKQLKMDCYALIGRLRLQLALHTSLVNDWSQGTIETNLKEASRNGALPLRGVLCALDYRPTIKGQAGVLELTMDDLQESWHQCVVYLHAVIRATVPSLTSQSKNGQASAINGQKQSPFFVVAESATASTMSQIAKASCSKIMQLLNQSTRDAGLVVGVADIVLPPVPEEPVAEEQFEEDDNLPIADHSGESPTKLWNMWSLMDNVEV